MGVSSKPLAVIDLGSHSALLLIARVEGEQLKVLQEDFVITRLGQGLNESGKLSKERQGAALQVLQHFKQKAEAHNCQSVQVIATEALRRAHDADEFIRQIEQELQLPVSVLSPQQEATCSYLGAISVIENFKNKRFTVIDVGGGSTEITLGQGQEIVKHASLPVGASRLAEAMDFKVKLGSSDRMGLMQIVKIELEKIAFWNEIDSSRVLVGSGGTVTTLAAIHHGMERYDAQRVSQTVLDREQIWKLYYQINDLDLEERLKLPGLEAGREDVITYGTIIYLTIMELRQLPWIRVSARGVRFGYLIKKDW